MQLILFDCDGTLADSQDAIVRAMDAAFSACGLVSPGRERTRGIIGLSLPQAMATLAPDASVDTHVQLAERYRAAAQRIRLAEAEEPLFAGADAAIRQLARRADFALGMATGKSRRGVDHLIKHYDWDGVFATLQTADDNPSKPHPGMIERAMAETATKPATTIMIGDTTFDMEMARAAGATAIAVTWGYHPVKALKAAGAHEVVDDFAALLHLLEHGRS